MKIQPRYTCSGAWVATVLLSTSLLSCGHDLGGPLNDETAEETFSFDPIAEDKSDSAGEAIRTALKQKYGVRPRNYGRLFLGRNSAQRRFLRALPIVTKFLNDQLTSAGFSLRATGIELATNFISEGGFSLLASNIVSGIDGFAHLGIDTLVDRYATIRHWLHDSIRRAVRKGDRTVTRLNEKGESVRTLTNLTIEEGLYANAGMFVWSKVEASKMMAAKGIALSTQPAASQFFWTTVVFNAGPGVGRSLFARHGIAFADQKWRQPDDPARFNRIAQFNAAWRTATFEFLRQTVSLEPPEAASGVGL